ncbi:MAG TPA: hypothetical protein VN577_09795 [Terriglobales bacterium]|nr:hypothetical protein [Terriglobales bacterium]
MRFLGTAIIFLCLAVSAAPQNPSHFANNFVKGLGYQITLPPDLVVNLEGSEEAAHGFTLDLLRPGDAHDWDRTPARYIAFGARFDTDEAGSLEAVIRQMTRNIENLVPLELQGRGELRLAGTFPAKLGNLPANRLVLEYRNSEKQPTLRQILVAYRARPDATAIIYVAILNTTRIDFQQDLKTFTSILSGFQLTSVE